MGPLLLGKTKNCSSWPAEAGARTGLAQKRVTAERQTLLSRRKRRSPLQVQAHFLSARPASAPTGH